MIEGWHSALMSYSLYLIRFSGGDAVAMDERLFDELVSAFVVRRDPRSGLVEVMTRDGDGALFYARSESEAALMGITVSRVPGVAVLDLLAQLAVRLDATIVLPEGNALIMRAEQRGHLPSDLTDKVAVIEPTGSAIVSAIMSA